MTYVKSGIASLQDVICLEQASLGICMLHHRDLIKYKSNVFIHSLSNLAESVALGRNLFENIRKFLQY